MKCTNISYSNYYKPVTLLFFIFICISISMFVCIITAALTTRSSNAEFHTFVQPDGTPVELKVYGDNFCIKAETPEGSIVVRDTMTDWICYAVPNTKQNIFISSGIPYIPGIILPGKDKESRYKRYFPVKTNN